ncbi:hypothetical protein OIE43_42320 [Streptomyces pseudovenezuelae]|uniref:Uncharacterized protein n=1 Tax=Streptomyces pseudovenezuelae TaxID=67350 RepID=A0ABZ1XA43_9ACTN|nr:hypothetical protein [Streptomyces pseudovenezuelae]
MGKTLGVLFQSLPAVQEPTRPWSAEDRQAAHRVGTDTRQMLASGERDFVWLTELIADKQQQFELAFGAWFSTAPLASQMKKSVSDLLMKRGGVTQLALQALAQLGDPELRQEVLGDGEQRLSSLGAFCMISAGIVGAEVAVGAYWEAAGGVAGMAAAGCTDL